MHPVLSPQHMEIETNKDRSVDPGDSFYDYCNGSWLKSHPIPATGTIGGVYDATTSYTCRLNAGLISGKP
jgi:Predicted metalloendopeptidase